MTTHELIRAIHLDSLRQMTDTAGAEEKMEPDSGTPPPRVESSAPGKGHRRTPDCQGGDPVRLIAFSGKVFQEERPVPVSTVFMGW